MRVGIVTPVVIQQPGMHAERERSAGITEIAEVARAADRLGFAYLTYSEHVAIPASQASIRSTAYWASAPTLGYLAACTQRIRLLSYCLVLGSYHPLEVAKTYGTLDRMSGGRTILGVGVGSLREEFELLGAPFEGRGERPEDLVAMLVDVDVPPGFEVVLSHDEPLDPGAEPGRRSRSSATSTSSGPRRPTCSSGAAPSGTTSSS